MTAVASYSNIPTAPALAPEFEAITPRTMTVVTMTKRLIPVYQWIQGLRLQRMLVCARIRRLPPMFEDLHLSALIPHELHLNRLPLLLRHLLVRQINMLLSARLLLRIDPLHVCLQPQTVRTRSTARAITMQSMRKTKV